MSAAGPKRLRLGILCGGPSLAAWQAECLKHLVASGLAEPALLLIRDEGGGDAAGTAVPLKTLLFRLYRRHRVAARSAALRPVPLPAALEGVEIRRYGELDGAALRARDLDLILAFHPGELPDEVLAAPRYGVWAYRHGDGQAHRGEPPCFREVCRGDAVTPAVLERLGGGGAGPAVLHRGAFRTEPGYVATLDAVLFGSADWGARVCREILLGQGERLAAPPAVTPAAARPAGPPGNGQMLWFLLRRLGAALAETWRRAFFLEIWNVGIVAAPVREILATGRAEPVRWWPELPGHRFVADPFGLARDGKVQVLVEDFDYAGGCGSIAAVAVPEVFAGGPPVPAIELPVHMSYPCLFEHDGDIFCVPETHEDFAVTLYRAVRFPDRWEPVRTLMRDVQIIDATVFRHEGRWWLFGTLDDEKGDLKLFAWYAEDLYGDWRPHPLNPLKCDVRSSRPAGAPFRVDGVLYRPAQDCSRTYGGALTINRVLTLTPTAFAEEPALHLAPRRGGPYPDGLHTLCPAGEVTIIDGKRFKFALDAFFIKRRYRTIQRRRWAANAPQPGGRLTGIA